MTPEHWATLDKASRSPWLEKTISLLAKDKTQRLPNVAQESEPDFSFVVEEQPWFINSEPSVLDIEPDEFSSLIDSIDLVVMTATQIERDSVLRLTKSWMHRGKILRVHIEAETYFLGQFGSFKVVVTKCQMGSQQPGSSTLAAEQAQRVCRPKAIVMIGIAFGKGGKQRIGDVLVASQIINYEPQRIGSLDIEDRGSIPPSNPTLLNRFDNVIGWDFKRPDSKSCSSKSGPILSGEKLVDEPEFKKSLFARYPNAIGGEMEGTGLCAAAIRSNVPWILVKSICDWADGHKHKRYQALAAASSASLVHHVLQSPSALNGLEKPRPKTVGSSGSLENIFKDPVDTTQLLAERSKKNS